MPIALFNSDEPIPSFIQLGFWMWALTRMGLPRNEVDSIVLDKWYDEYRQYIMKLQREAHEVRNLTIEQASYSYERTVQWCVERLKKQRYISMAEARDIADGLAVQNFRVTPGHVREAIQRIRKPKQHHNEPGESRHDKPAQADFEREAV